MGWANCGTDSIGRPIGYAHEATCDHPGCAAEIHRGLAFACGDMHGDDEVSCEKYFCDEHLSSWALQPYAGGRVVRVCADCAAALKEASWVYDEEEGYLHQLGQLEEAA